MRHFDHVHSDVDHRPAALELLSPENAPVGNAAAAQCLAFHEHDVSKLPLIASADDELRGGVIAELKTAHEFLFRLLRGLDHLLALGRIHGHRFFGDDMRAGIGSVDRCGGVLRRLGGEQLGAEESRVDDRGVDAERLDLGGERLHPAVDAELRGGVGGAVLEAGEPRGRRDGHDVPGALAAHDW